MTRGKESEKDCCTECGNKLSDFEGYYAIIRNEEMVCADCKKRKKSDKNGNA